MRAALFTVLALFTAVSTHAQTVTTGDFVTADSIPLDAYVGGRVLRGAFAKPTASGEVDGAAYVHQWPGVYFEGVFAGAEVALKFNDSANKYNLIIDDNPPILIDRPGAKEIRVSGLDGANPHIIRLEKTTESQDATGEFDGFFIPPGETAMAPMFRERAIEFIGDSYSAGYGNTSTIGRDCPGDGVWANTDTQQAWGPLVARHYDANYRVNAYSGFGIVRNYNGVAPKRSLVKFYPYALFDEAAPADDSDWNPNVIVIALGGNDFSTPVHAGERWADEDALTVDYIATYVAFVQSLHAAHPDANFVLVTYGQERVRSALQVVLDRLAAAGDTRAALLDVGSGFALTGCDWHLNLDDDRRIAATVERYLDQHPDIWGTNR